MAVYIKAFFDWVEQTAALSDAERGRLFEAILEYGRTGEVPELGGNERFLFPVFKAQLDREEGTSNLRSKSGAKGGKVKQKPAKEDSEENSVSEKQTEAEAGTPLQNGDGEANVSKPKQNENSEANVSKPKQNENLQAKLPNKEKEKEEEKEEDNNPLPATQWSPKGKGRKGRPPTELPEDFALFWEEYPRKDSRQEALKSWLKLNPSPELAEAIIQHVRQRKQTWDWQKDGGQFVPHAATFLNQRRWEDPLTHSKPPATGRAEPRDACTFADLWREECV